MIMIKPEKNEKKLPPRIPDDNNDEFFFETMKFTMNKRIILLGWFTITIRNNDDHVAIHKWRYGLVIIKYKIMCVCVCSMSIIIIMMMIEFISSYWMNDFHIFNFCQVIEWNKKKNFIIWYHPDEFFFLIILNLIYITVSLRVCVCVWLTVKIIEMGVLCVCVCIWWTNQTNWKWKTNTWWWWWW